MKPQDYRNGDGGSGGARDSDSEGSEGGASDELSVCDSGLPARALAALNALRKSRQHYDVVLVGGGGEAPAHRAVLAAVSPYLLERLPASAPPEPQHYRVEGVDADSLHALVEYAYTGRVRVRDACSARRLYLAAWRLRLDAVRAHLADGLMRRLAPHDCVETRALPDLAPHHLALVDAYIAEQFEAVCAAGALAPLPLARLDLLRDPAASPPLAVADAALTWLSHLFDDDDRLDLEELCSRTHLLYVDGGGELRDCGELPAARGDSTDLCEYRREAAERGARRRHAPLPPRPLPGLELGARAARPGSGATVVAARRTPGGVTRALLAVRGRLAAARIAWREAAGPVALEEGSRRAELRWARAAHGTAAVGDRLIVCGGYDRARVLRSAEQYDPVTNVWTEVAEMRVARARFPAAVCGGSVIALGGSDGHAELDSVDALRADGNAWAARARLPAARSHAAAAADSAGTLWLVGGWAAGHCLKRVHRYSAEDDAWTEAPSLSAGRSQCAAVVWEGAVWALGGCDAWHCLASTERLALGLDSEAAWAPGPALPTARRSAGACAWRGALVVAGGSDGAGSLRRTDWLRAGDDAWRAGPALRRPRADLGLAALKDALYAVAGFSGKEFLNCVECLYEPDGEWTALCEPTRPSPPPLPPTETQEEKCVH